MNVQARYAKSSRSKCLNRQCRELLVVNEVVVGRRRPSQKPIFGVEKRYATLALAPAGAGPAGIWELLPPLPPLGCLNVRDGENKYERWREERAGRRDGHNKKVQWFHPRCLFRLFPMMRKSSKTGRRAPVLRENPTGARVCADARRGKTKNPAGFCFLDLKHASDVIRTQKNRRERALRKTQENTQDAHACWCD